MRAALRRFGAWYWFHIKRALWKWDRPHTFKCMCEELWSFFIVLVVYKVIFVALFLLVLLAVVGLEWIGVL